MGLCCSMSLALVAPALAHHSAAAYARKFLSQ
jgi:hypothetical protein